MINIKCNNMHKYGPFIKNNEGYQRTCLKCKKKTQYPNVEDITKEYNNQYITNSIIDIIIEKKIKIINTSDYFTKIITILLDNTSYIFLTENKQNKLITSIKEINNYYNNNNEERYTLIDEFKNYLIKYFNNYNKEIGNIYNDKDLEIIDNMFQKLKIKFSNEFLKITDTEENNTIELTENKIRKNDLTINLENLPNET